MKRILCIILCVVILSMTLGTKYFDSNHMEKVEAVEEVLAVGLSASALYAICYYVGTVAYANAPIEMNTLSDDQIASMGYSTISYMTASNMMGIPAAPNSPIIGFIDKVGQSYVFGSEALKTVADTSFQVIQGGKKPDDDDDDDEGGIIDNLIKFPGNVKDLSAVCTTAFGAILGAVVKDQYNKFMNDDESIYDSVIEQNFTGYDQNLDGTYNVIGTYSYSYMHLNKQWYSKYILNQTILNKKAYVLLDSNYYGYTHYSVSYYDDYGLNLSWNCYDSYADRWYYNINNISIGGSSWFNFSMNINLPIFATKEAALAALESNDYSYALNYTKEYRIADWLQDDWEGVLIDPLTGLHALSDWANIARHQGLSALGNELDLDSFKDYLRDFFTNLGTSPGTDPQPAVDPSKAPILYPSGNAEGALDPDTDIDPSRRPVIFPDPSINPNPNPDLDPDPDPGPGVMPLPDMNAADYKVDLKSIFPFCIPFDFVALLKALDAEPQAPCFTFPVVIPALEYREDVELDMSIFDDVAKVIRLCEKVSFILFLMFVTSKVIRW